MYNGRNVIIDGYRGIGKSSLALQLLYVTQGDTDLLEKYNIDLGDFTFDNLCGDHRCLPGNNLANLVEGLLATLKISLGKFTDKETQTSSTKIKLKIFERKTSSSTKPISPSDLSVGFVVETKQILQEAKYEAKGLTFLIDEVDVLQDNIELASFIKATVEKFRADSYFSVNFIVSGVTGTTTKLISQHPSSERLFEHVVIPRMTMPELVEVIDTTLKGTPVDMTHEAKLRICKLANELPHPVHLLGYHSYRLDMDNNINPTDVEKAVNFITTNVRKQHFQDVFDQIGHGTEVDVIKAMALERFQNINAAHLAERLFKRDEIEIYRALENLEQMGVVEKRSRGQYRFLEPLFNIYLRQYYNIYYKV